MQKKFFCKVIFLVIVVFFLKMFLAEIHSFKTTWLMHMTCFKYLLPRSTEPWLWLWRGRPLIIFTPCRAWHSYSTCAFDHEYEFNNDVMKKMTELRKTWLQNSRPLSVCNIAGGPMRSNQLLIAFTVVKVLLGVALRKENFVRWSCPCRTNRKVPSSVTSGQLCKSM